MPEHLDQLKHRQLRLSLHADIHIYPEAGPDLLTDVKLLARFPCFQLKLEDPDRNSVKLISAIDKVQAQFISDAHLILGLPDDFEFYYLFMYHGMNVSDAEIAYMLTWKHARSLEIAHAFNSVMDRLSHNVTKLQGMSALAYLRFSIDESSYLTVRIGNFLNHLPELETLEIRTFTVPKEEVERFMRLQGALSKWNVEYKVDPWSAVLITKKKGRKNRKNNCNFIE